ncbi:MAG: LemA family protein [Tannerellaceae bacterium]|nr:LemA family protein [Tannerellaceae bacterium]
MQSKRIAAGITIAIALPMVILFFWMKSNYNSMIQHDEDVKTAWSQVENQYQRRADLIPNLVNTVKAYAEHEQETLKMVVEARALATSLMVHPESLSSESLSQYQNAQAQLSTALGRLMMITEQYPDLKSNQSFRELQVQFEGTENRIAVERQRFNETARKYNSYIRKFPNNTLAGIFRFSPQAYFTADPGTNRAISIEF